MTDWVPLMPAKAVTAGEGEGPVRPKITPVDLMKRGTRMVKVPAG